jgi:hypothetical protein
MNKLSFVLGLSLLGCGTDGPSGPETLPNLEVPEVPENGVQIITPIFENIQPGTDNEICAWSDVILDKQTDIKTTVGYQTEPPGHHAILFYTLDPQPPGQRRCTDTDMATFRYLTGNGSNGEPNTAPGDLVFRVPAGAQLVVNSHYLNTSDEVVKGQSLINVLFAEPGKQYTASGSTVFLDSSIEVPLGVSTFKTSCIVDKQQKFWYMIPHMHRWGTNIKVDLTRKNSTTAESLFDTDWREQYTFHPPEKRFDPKDPFIINVGDQVDVTCTWNNDEPNTLAFGFEMCVASGSTVDEEGRGSWACNGGRWHTF